jgi:hypothetical protein
VTSSILADTALADTIHALAELERRPNDLTFVRDRLAVMDAALSAFESTLAQPLAELGPDVHRTYLAALALAYTLTGFPGPDVAGMRRTTLRLLDMLEPLAAPTDRAFRARLLGQTSVARSLPTARA